MHKRRKFSLVKVGTKKQNTVSILPKTLGLSKYSRYLYFVRVVRLDADDRSLAYEYKNPPHMLIPMKNHV